MVHKPPKKSNQNFTMRPSNLNTLWLNLNNTNEMSILQSKDKQGSPSFYFHAPGSKRRYPCTQAASAVRKYFPRLLQFCTGYRI